VAPIAVLIWSGLSSSPSSAISAIGVRAVCELWCLRVAGMATASTPAMTTAPTMSVIVVRRLILPALVGEGVEGCGRAGFVEARDAALGVLRWAVTRLPAGSVGGRGFATEDKGVADRESSR
jgi:hypothetical protein